MTRQELVAQALAAWLAQTLNQSADAAREALPPMDVQHFFRELAQLRDFERTNFRLLSLALA